MSSLVRPAPAFGYHAAVSEPRSPRPDEFELELDLDHDPARTGETVPMAPGPDRAAFSPFANPRAVVPVAVATQTRPNLDQPVPPAELIPLDLEDAPQWGPPHGSNAMAHQATVPVRPNAVPGAPAAASAAASFDADLDLPAQPARARQPAAPRANAPVPSAPAPAPAPGDPSAYFGSGTFDEGSLETRSIEPSGGGGPLDYFGGGTFGDDDFEGFSQSNALSLSVEQSAGSPRRADEGARWPSGRSPDPATLRPDEVEMALAADYGPPPTAVWMTPIYAVRVFARQRALRPIVAEKKAALDRAEIARDEHVMDAVQAVRAHMETDENLRRMLAPVHERETVANQRKDAVASTNADYSERIAQIDARQQEHEAHLSQKRAEERRHADVVAVAEEPHRKAVIHFKRLQIELRSLNQVAQNAAKTGGSLAPDHTAKVQHFDAQARDVKAQVDALAAEVDVARAPLLAVQKEISGLERALRDLATQRRGLDAEFAKQMGARSAGLDAATRELREAFAQVGRSLLATRGAVAIPETHLEAIRAGDEAVLRASLDLELHLRAIDSCDHDLVKRGHVVLACIAGGLILLVVLLVAL